MDKINPTDGQVAALCVAIDEQANIIAQLRKELVAAQVSDRKAVALLYRWTRAYSQGPLADQYLRSDTQAFLEPK